MLCPETDDYEQQLFIIVDNEVLLEVSSYKQSPFCFVWGEALSNFKTQNETKLINN